MKGFSAACAAAMLAAVTAAGCGGDDGSGASGGKAATTLTVYSSLPLQGASRNQATAIGNGIELALKQVGGRIGDYAIKYVPLDDSTAQAGSWTPEATSANALKAANDESAIAYLGEFNSGASAVSVPILNEARVPQNGLTNTAVGLTTDEPGSNPGEPGKYYPTGSRHYVRIVPKDTIQGAALATLMKQDGCTNVFVLNDKEVFGAGLATNLVAAAKAQSLAISGSEGIDKTASNYRSLAAAAKSNGTDCMVYAGVTANNAVQIFKDFAAALPGGKLYGPDGIAESGFADPDEGGIPPEVQSKVKVEREAVIKELFATKDRQSVLGTYSIDGNGDTTLTDYGAYRIEDGALVFDQTIKARS